jgi:hypothetical protein
LRRVPKNRLQLVRRALEEAEKEADIDMDI